jgi:hypothetical protein
MQLKTSNVLYVFGAPCFYEGLWKIETLMKINDRMYAPQVLLQNYNFFSKKAIEI